MGCGASNNANVAGPGEGPRRTTTTTTVPVQRSVIVPRPLMKSKNYRHGSQLTLRELERLRAEFWTTRTEGNALMWINIRSAAEALVSNDLPLANAILLACNIVSPTGNMDMLYDERGAQYKVPIYCIANPVELMGENGMNGDEGPGQTPPPPQVFDGVPISLRVRVNPGDVNIAVAAVTSFTIAELKRAIVATSLQ
ncbi:hypothetical protein B484DRAFT_459161, partial [Ochromonadaceae sp. CCMP2298]